MKSNILILLFIILFSNSTLGQQGRNKTFVKQLPKMSTSKPKIHANSNSVFGTGNTHPKYNKETIPAKGKRKREVEIKTYKKPKK